MYLEIVLNDNNLPCFKPIRIPCNSFAGSESRSIQLGPGSQGNKASKSRRWMHAANILDFSIDCNTVLANAQPQQQVNSARC